MNYYNYVTDKIILLFIRKVQNQMKIYLINDDLTLRTDNNRWIG